MNYHSKVSKNRRYQWYFYPHFANRDTKARKLNPPSLWSGESRSPNPYFSVLTKIIANGYPKFANLRTLQNVPDISYSRQKRDSSKCINMNGSFSTGINTMNSEDFPGPGHPECYRNEIGSATSCHTARK